MNTQTLSQQGQQTAQSMTKQISSLVEGCCLIGANIRSSSGERTLPNAKVEVDGDLLSTDLVKGSKLQWFPKSKLSITTKYTQRISRLLSNVGVKYGDLTVVPKDKLDFLQPRLEEIKESWSADVNQLIADFDDIMADHIDSNPTIAPLIRKYALEKDVFRNCFKLTYLKPLAIQPLCDDDIDEIESAVASTMWEEVAKEALNLYKASWFKAKVPVNRVTQGVRNPLKRIKEKLLSLSFLDEGVINVTRTFDDLLQALPSAGYIEGHDFSQLTNWIHVLSDEAKLRMHAEGTSMFSYKALVAKQTQPSMLEAQPQSANEGNQPINSTSQVQGTSQIESNTVKGRPYVQKPVSTTQLGFGLNF